MHERGGGYLSNINTDLDELLQIVDNMKIAISSIEKTESNMKRIYQQLGETWNDKKYKELGDLTYDCRKALNDILNIMLKGEKYVCTLAKSIQEYDNVYIDSNGSMLSDNSFVQNLRTTALGGVNHQSYQYCLGVLTRGKVSEDYLNVVSDRHDRGETSVRRVFDYFANQLMIQDAELPTNQIQHYFPMNYEGHRRGVYYNATSDMSNPKGAGTTYFHELGHMIDHASTGYRGNLSNSPEFGRALVEDGQRVLQLFNRMSAGQQHSFLRRIYSNEAHSFSDLIDATTNGQLHGRYGHTREYWARPGTLQAEAFAHFFEASMGGEEKLALLAHFFPTAFAYFSTMIESIQPEQYVRNLER